MPQKNVHILQLHNLLNIIFYRLFVILISTAKQNVVKYNTKQLNS